MSRVTPLGLRVRQWRGRRGGVALFALLVAALTAAGVALPGLLAAADEDRFAAALAADGGAAAEISLGVPWTADPATMVPAVDEALDRALAHVRPVLRAHIGETGWVLSLAPVAVTGPVLPQPEDALRMRLGADPGLAAHATLDAGVLPGPWQGTGELPVALEAAAADALGVGVGDVLSAEGARIRVTGVVAGTATGPGASSRAAVSRLDAERLRDGRQVFTIGAWVSPDSIPALAPLWERARVSAFWAISADGLRVSDRDELAAAVRAATAAGASLRDGTPFEVSSPLPTVLARSAAAEATAHSLVWLLSTGWLAALAAAAVVVAAGLSRAALPSRALLRARGAPPGRLLRDGALDLALVALPAVAAGAALALAAAPAGAGTALALAPAAVLVAGALGAAVALPRLPARRAIAVASGALAVLVGVAAVVALRARGYAQGKVLDPLLASAPATAALAVSVVAAALLPLLLSAASRAAGRARRPTAWLGARWGVRRGGRLSAVVALVLAVSCATTAVCIGAALADGLDRAARNEVGADLRVDPTDAGVLPDPAGLAGLPGVADAAGIDEIVQTGVTEDGRPRAVRVFVADTGALARVRPDLPVLGPGEALAPESLASALDGEVVIEGVGSVQVRFAPVAMPRAPERWLLIDEVSASAPRVPAMVVVDTDGSPAAGDEVRRVTDAPVVAAADVRARLGAGPTVGLLGGTLLVGAVLPIALAVVAVVSGVLASHREREDVWAIARLSGGADRGRAVLVLWQIVPAATVAALLGTGTGIAAAAAVQAATDLSAATGGEVLAAPPPLLVWAIAPAAILVATLAGLLAAHLSRQRSLASLVRNGAS